MKSYNSISLAANNSNLEFQKLCRKFAAFFCILFCNFRVLPETAALSSDFLDLPEEV